MLAHLFGVLVSILLLIILALLAVVLYQQARLNHARLQEVEEDEPYAVRAAKAGAFPPRQRL